MKVNKNTRAWLFIMKLFVKDLLSCSIHKLHIKLFSAELCEAFARKAPHIFFGKNGSILHIICMKI